MRVLLVEDDKPVSTFVRRGLTKEGIPVDVQSAQRECGAAPRNATALKPRDVAAAMRNDYELSADHAAEIHRFVARRVANCADAADIAQQTLLLACAKNATRHGENFPAWLLTIARHLIVDHYRTQSRYQFVELGTPAMDNAEPALQTPADAVPSSYDCSQRLASLLDRMTRRLPLQEQVAVLLADIYGHHDKDSAAMLRMSVPSFKLLLHVARARLHQTASVNHPASRKCGVRLRLGMRKLLAVHCRLMEGLRQLWSVVCVSMANGFAEEAASAVLFLG